MAPVAIARKFGTKSARAMPKSYIRDLFDKQGLFGDQAIEWRQRNFKKTDPGCHCNENPGCRGNEICDKMGHNLTCMGNITEIFAPSSGFWGLGYWTTSDKFYHDRPPLSWQRNLTHKIGSMYRRSPISFHLMEVFGFKLLNDTNPDIILKYLKEQW